MQVCVPVDRDSDNNRCFGSFTCNYEKIASWLKACNITTVAMESTGSYWVGIYFFLEEREFDVLLANARDVKNVSGKKTDEVDAEWIMWFNGYEGEREPFGSLCNQPLNSYEKFHQKK